MRSIVCANLYLYCVYLQFSASAERSDSQHMPAHLGLLVNSSFELRCGSYRGGKLPHKWLHNGQPIAPNNTRLQPHENVLSMKNLKFSDAGGFTYGVGSKSGSWCSWEVFVLSEMGAGAFDETAFGWSETTSDSHARVEVDCQLSGEGRHVWFQHKEHNKDYRSVQDFIVRKLFSGYRNKYFAIFENERTRAGLRKLYFEAVTKYNQSWYSCVLANSTSGRLAVFSTYLNVSKSWSWLHYSIASVMAVGVLLILLLVYLLCKLHARKKQLQCWKKIIVVEPCVSDGSFRPPTIKIEHTVREMLHGMVDNASYGYNPYEFPLDATWELPRAQVMLAHELGKGQFGRGHMGTLQAADGRHLSVAVKMVKDAHMDDQVSALMHELEVLKIIGHHANIINLVGACTQHGPLWVLVEYACYGNLKDFLRNCKCAAAWPELQTCDLLRFCTQIAHGMLFLAAQKCIHRDLAARNVLVTEDFNMKIADFGLARELRGTDYYRRRIHGRLPLRWLSPESLASCFFSTETDVWSYGVVCWEIMMDGCEPYGSIESPTALFAFLCTGHRLAKPARCSKELFMLLLHCWAFEPCERPSFPDIVRYLEWYMANRLALPVPTYVNEAMELVSEL